MKHSIVAKLSLRERRGSLQPHLRGNRERLFKKCPQRFCIPLESILDVNGVLRKGHVILGFTKNGRYLISYCLKIDNDDSSPMPRYAYSLHWWQFHQWRPLVQVFTVPLFDEEEIHEDLHLMVAESPDESQIVVYGEIRCFKEDQSHQCYVTVCAGPSPRPCPVCKYAPLGGITARCLKHSFVVNFKYDLLPPFPLFNPSTNLKMEDTVLFNTGDFLMALRVLTTDGHGNNFPEVLKSLNPDRKDHISNTSCSSLGEQASTANPDIGYVSCQCSDTARGDVNVNVPVGRLSAEDMEVRSNRDVSEESSSEIKPGSTQSTCAMHKHVDRRRIVSGFVDGLNQIHGEQRHAHELTKEECVSHSQHVINEQECQDQNSLRSNHDSALETKECCDGSGNLDNTDGFCNISNLLSDSVQTSKSIANTYCGLHTTETGTSPCTVCTCSNVLDGSSPFVQNNKELSSICNNSPESDCNGNCDLDFPHKGPDTCTSCSRSVPVPVLNNNNLTSSVFKVYTESIHVPSYHEPTDMTDDFDMYDGSLPLTVKTRHGRTLQQVFKLNESNPNPTSKPSFEGNGMLHALAVQQVTLDVEQCINELILAHEGLKDSYKSLKDYDVQVVGVCPDSGEVIAMAKLLVYTRIRQQSASCGLPVSPSPVLQSTGFIFSWNIWSGDVRILQVLQLENYPERTRYSKFNIAAKEASELRAKFSIPQSISSFVQAFSNHTVFTGKSLKYLRHPFLPLVVLL